MSGWVQYRVFTRKGGGKDVIKFKKYEWNILYRLDRSDVLHSDILNSVISWNLPLLTNENSGKLNFRSKNPMRHITRNNPAVSNPSNTLTHPYLMGVCVDTSW